ncbi:hypothetical protein CBS101457_006617 [Exobasidium rhododendri]|nr:hypothetical protein CBS101457_006617 [Exobasidium rhododendri]
MLRFTTLGRNLRPIHNQLFISHRDLPRRTLASVADNARPHVRIVEVSPRDGLQNEKGQLSTDIKVELINRLQDAGAKCIESGSFVSPKWVPNMKDTAQVLRQINTRAGISYPVLVPNEKGLDQLLALLKEGANSERSILVTDEIAVFTAASESFCRANTNCSITESLNRLATVSQRALDAGLKVRGYISVVAICPYEGIVSHERVGDIADKMLQMGCYEVSLGDTVGSASPSMMLDVLNACTKKQSVDKFAAHCHDTMGTGLANVLALVNAGVRSVDAAVGGLGGCPYSPGATGNIDTESVVYALEREGYQTGIDLKNMVQIGAWISKQVGRPYNSSAGRALLARIERQKQTGESRSRL